MRQEGCSDQVQDTWIKKMTTSLRSLSKIEASLVGVGWRLRARSLASNTHWPVVNPHPSPPHPHQLRVALPRQPFTCAPIPVGCCPFWMRQSQGRLFLVLNDMGK